MSDPQSLLRPQISLEAPLDDDVDTASAFRPVLPRDNSSNLLTPNGRFQLPPIETKPVNRLRASNSFGDLKSEGEKLKDKSRLRKSNAVIDDRVPVPKIKELRSLSITVPPNSFDVVSHLVSPLPTHKQFRHTESIQRYDDEEVSLLNQYQLEEIIGHGSYGVVRRAVTGSNEVKALKIVSKRKLTRKLQPPRRFSTPNRGNSPSPTRKDPLAGIYREIAILKKLDHPNVVKLLEVMEDPHEDEIILVFEYIERGPLMDDRLGNPFPEDQSRGYFLQLILGLEYLHHQKVIHRDIKPSNLLVANDNKIKIADFGVSEMFNKTDSDVQLTTSAGTPAFMAPECLDLAKSSYLGKAVDIWAAGVTLYCMMYGKVPFFHPVLPELHEVIRTQELTFPESPSSSDDVKDLMERMMEKDPLNRISIDGIREHPWIRKSGTMIPSKSQNCLELIDPHKDEVNRAVKKTTYPIYILTLIRGMAKRRSLKNPMSDSSPTRKNSKSSRNGDGRSSPAPSPSSSPTPVPGSTSPKRRHSFKKFFKARPKSPDAVDSSSPPANHRATHNSSPLTISHHNSPPNTPTSSPPRSPVLPRPHERLVKSNSHLNITHTATSVSSVSSNGDDYSESSDSN